MVDLLYKHILKKKIRFPILEFIAAELYETIPKKEQLRLADKIIECDEIGGNVIAGFLLQLRLEKHFTESITKAVEYIIYGNKWYVCDIIGERVMGHALLTEPEKIMPLLNTFTKHEDKWMVRSAWLHIMPLKKVWKKSFRNKRSKFFYPAQMPEISTQKRELAGPQKQLLNFTQILFRKTKRRLKKIPK
jgi:hypothetical protein